MSPKITKVGNSATSTLPKDVLARLQVSQGDTIYATEASGGIRLTAANLDFAPQMALVEQILREDRDILRAMATEESRP